jgi:hypothetical protein
LAVLVLAGPAVADDEVGTEPITCWWATDKTTVLVGERFGLTLTCGVVEASRVKVVADFNQLEPSAVTLSPFEIVGGTRYRDIQAPPWRYAQFTYTLRLIGDAYFGKDVEIPSLKVTYRIQSSIGGGNEGRDQTYLLPALPLRVMSLVPKKAGDIRDGTHDLFGDIESRRFRATAELVASAVFFGFALVTLGLAGVRVWGRARDRSGAPTRPIGASAVLSGCTRAVRHLRADVAREGWTPQLVARAISVFRIAGAVATDRRVAQAVVDHKAPRRDGQLAIPRGLLRRKHALVSAPTTPKAMAAALESSAGDHARLPEIQEALEVFSAARYGRSKQLDITALDRALEEGASALRRLRLARQWPARTATRLMRSAVALKESAWSR